MSGCVYPGDLLTYECTVMGLPGEATVWTGSAFNCASSSNEIVLLHRPIISDNVYYSTCNGAIVARILSVEGNNFTSQLNVTVTSEIIGKTIECLHDDGTIVYTQFSSTISIAGLSPSA